jgi:E3 ubiquitin-protein ligase MARCH6
MGFVRSLMRHYSPIVVRVLLCASLWLLVAPVVTAWLYLGWMRKPSYFLTRWNHWELLSMDWMSGAVVAALIIIAFLSLMSFADFMRAQVVWNDEGDENNNNINNNNQGAMGPGRANNNNRNGHGGAGVAGRQEGRRRRRLVEEPPVEPTEDEIDNTVWVQAQERAEKAQGQAHAYNDWLAEHQSNEDETDDVDDDNNDDDDDASWDPEDDDDDDSFNGLVFDDDDASDGEDEDQPLLEVARRRRQGDGANNRNNNNQQPEQPPQPPQRQEVQRNDVNLDDDDVMDINIALDELLGVHGPVGTVFRNLLWLLAFNAVFLGFFAFSPRVVGSTVSTMLFNHSNVFSPEASGPVHMDNNATFALNNLTVGVTSPVILLNLTRGSVASVFDVLRAVEAESERLKTTFKLSDLFTIAVGYLTCAAIVIVAWALLVISRKIKIWSFFRGRTGIRALRLEGAGGRVDGRDALGEINRIINNGNHDVDEQEVAVALAARVAVDVMASIVKVGLLLALKMFCLPIAVGIFLDASSLSLFGGSLESRVAYAGRDLFSFILLHWVAGITFMLLVTVSVLQLREVAHPKLLGQVIRPQEPQPDLLGNLLNETVPTHAKRMALSIIIYAALLTMHVHIPIQLISSSRLLDYAPYLRLKFCYVMMTQLQIPLELLFFHLCMLGILEKNKNSIGELQHHWFKFVGRLLGLTGVLLPRVVREFRLIGSRSIFDGSRVDPFWILLAKANERDREQIMKSNLREFELEDDEPQSSSGTTKANGERVLTYGTDFVRIPTHSQPGRVLRSRATLLPTKIGRYRLYRTEAFASNVPVFQLWEEVPGEVIPRPPEGWDDLGAGGADVQGRWAFSNEKKSNLERGVACPETLYSEKDSFLRRLAVSFKMLVIALMSWIITTLFLVCLFAGPLATGRLMCYVLRVPDNWIHDPFVFAVGYYIFFPALLSFLKSMVCSNDSSFEKIFTWIRQFRTPPPRKRMTLLITVFLMGSLSPLLVGSIVDVAFIKSNDWFQGNEEWIDTKSFVLNWLVGIPVLSFFLRFASNERNMGFMEDQFYGRDGHAATFIQAIRAICRFEWDKVDARLLLNDVSIPIAFDLTLELGGPMLVLLLSFLKFPFYPVARRRLVTRTCLFLCTMLLSQTQKVWRSRLRRWFEAAHRVARDDRYLIGEVLLNYGEQ